MPSETEPTCVHPFETRVRTDAIIPYFYQDTDAKVFDVEPAFKCMACGHYVVPDGVLVERMPVIFGAAT